MEQDNISISWKDLPWKKFARKTFRLQCKIYKAKQNHDRKQIKRFQKLLLHSNSLHYLAVRKVMNFSKVALTLSEEEKVKVVNHLANILLLGKDLNFKSNKRFYLGTFNSTISLLLDKALQYAWKFVLEPIYGAFPKACNNNFSHQNGEIQKLFKLANKKIVKFTLDTSLRSVSVNNLKTLVALPLNQILVLYRFLNASPKNLEDSFYRRSIRVFDIRIFLVGILLKTLKNFDNNCTFVTSTNMTWNSPVEGLYAFDRGAHEADSILYLKNLLSGKGLSLNLKETSVVSLLNGFEFSGFCFRLKSSKNLIIKPSKYEWIKFRILLKRLLKKTSFKVKLKLTWLKHFVSSWLQKNRICNRSDLRFKIYLLREQLNKYLRTSTSLYKEMRHSYVKYAIKFSFTSLNLI